MKTVVAVSRLKQAREAALMVQCALRREKAVETVDWRRARAPAINLQARYRGHRVRAVEVPPFHDPAARERYEMNALINAAITVQRAFHMKRARAATLARKKKLNDFYTVRAVRTVQRAFRRTPDRIVASVLRGLCSGVVLLSVSHSAEANAARRINACAKKLVERKRRERAAAKRAREEERMHLLMAVNLGQRDSIRAVPWSTYARKAAHHSMAEDGGLSLHGGPPRRSAYSQLGGSESSVQVKKFGGLTSVVGRTPRTGVGGGFLGDSSAIDEASSGHASQLALQHHHPLAYRSDDPTRFSTESLTELLPGQDDLLPNFGSGPGAPRGSSAAPDRSSAAPASTPPLTAPPPYGSPAGRRRCRPDWPANLPLPRAAPPRRRRPWSHRGRGQARGGARPSAAPRLARHAQLHLLDQPRRGGGGGGGGRRVGASRRPKQPRARLDAGRVATPPRGFRSPRARDRAPWHVRPLAAQSHHERVHDERVREGRRRPRPRKDRIAALLVARGGRRRGRCVRLVDGGAAAEGRPRQSRRRRRRRRRRSDQVRGAATAPSAGASQGVGERGGRPQPDRPPRPLAATAEHGIICRVGAPPRPSALFAL